MDSWTSDKPLKTMPQHSYRLQPYAGVQSRHTCPSCGRKRCFTLYIDEIGRPLADNVGRCDHESSCGYHYTPADYYRDYPYESNHPFRAQSTIAARGLCHKRHTTVPCTIPWQFIEKSVRTDIRSTLIEFLNTSFDPGTIETTIAQYHLGVTKDRSIIFFQIDTDGNCRTGKIMKYNEKTGHRIKDESIPFRITWVHSILKSRGILPPSWQLTQCLFGEHLLLRYPDKKVALVESEKTAVICAALMPAYIWLATGGKTQLGDKLKVLTGREVIAFPDVDGYAVWKERLSMIQGVDIKVSDYLERNATEQDRQDHIDIADLLLRTATAQNPPAIPQSDTYPILKYFAPKHHKLLKEFIEELDLIPVSIRKIP